MPSPVVIVTERASQRWRSGHPWIYRSDLVEPAAEKARELPAGAVAVRDRRGGWLGCADYSPASQIALRRLSDDPKAIIDDAWLSARIAAALRYRGVVVRDSDCYRAVWGEADRLPGLVVDRYATAIVIQALTAAMDARLPRIVALLDQMLQPEVILERNDARVRALEALELRSGLLKGASAHASGTIGGVRFGFDLLHGQKTGGFLDQRENWQAVADYAARLGCTGDALDAFTYQGGFALYLARCCSQVEAADISRPALEQAEANAALNDFQNVEWIEANAFDLLRDYEARGRHFDVVVLDPPTFARQRDAISGAERGYKEINLRALKLLRPGGLLVSCSCSHHLSEARLLEIIAEAALDARCQVTVLERRTQALDHPILLTVPETCYLKCVIATVRR